MSAEGFYYWTTLTSEDDDETSLSTLSPLVNLSAATQKPDDTFIRAIMWPSLGVTVGPTSLPPLDWLAAACVDYLYYFDSVQLFTPVNLTDENPLTIGFQRLNLTVRPGTAANTYEALWQGPPQGLNLEGKRKGFDASILPAFSAQRWVSDNHGVWDNFAHYGATFSSRCIGRVLWFSHTT